jgi:hypothetical protein
MGSRQRFAVPVGWIARGFRFEVEPTSPEQGYQPASAHRRSRNW